MVMPQLADTWHGVPGAPPAMVVCTLAGTMFTQVTDFPLGESIATIYGQYVKSGDMTGSAASSFTSLVPFVEDTADYTVLAAMRCNNDTNLLVRAPPTGFLPVMPQGSCIRLGIWSPVEHGRRVHGL